MFAIVSCMGPGPKQPPNHGSEEPKMVTLITGLHSDADQLPHLIFSVKQAA